MTDGGLNSRRNRFSVRHYLTTIIITFLITVPCVPAQEGSARSADQLIESLPDSLRSRFKSEDQSGDSLGKALTADTLRTAPTRQETDLDTIIIYSADSVAFTFSPRVTLLEGNARIKYGQVALEADRIDVHWENQLLFAKGRLDTIKLDSTRGGKDSLNWIGMPEFDDGTQVVVGKSMTYNLQTKQGNVVEGKTDYQDGFYIGTRIKRIDAGTYNIKSGYYTTCDAPEPHFNFWSRDMKLIIKDKVIAKPVVLYFGPVPVMILPFGVFSAHGGRHSGIIVPGYGESANSGQYFKNFGYYWAPSDYFDVRTSLDYYQKTGVLFRGDAYYTVRYKLDGSVSGTFTNKSEQYRVQRSWDIALRHRQVIDPSLVLNATGYYVSDASYLKNISQDPNQRMRRIIRSNASLAKNWLESPYSGSVNLNWEKDISSESVSYSMPQISFRRATTPLIPLPAGVKQEEGNWYNKVKYTYDAKGEIRTQVSVLPAGGKQSVARSGVKHNLSINATPDPLHYIAWTPVFNYSEVWLDQWNEYSIDRNNVIRTVKHDGIPDGLIARRTFSSSLRLSTKLYGLFKTKILSLQAIRHTVSPSLNMQYQPDFSDPKWGYYNVLDDTSGREILKDKFEGNIYGRTPQGEQRTLGIGLGNVFEYKMLKDDQEVKGELLSLQLGTSHNFAADSLKWGNLTSSAQISPLKTIAGDTKIFGTFSGMTLVLSTTHSFYRMEKDERGVSRQVDKPAEGGLRLLNFDLKTGFSFKGIATVTSRDTSSYEETETDRFSTRQWRPSTAPWSAGFSFRYGETILDADNIRKTINGGLNLELQATKNWKISYNTQVDLHERKVTSTSISIYRDLHCWEGSLILYPMGIGKGFYMRINIKSPQLQDVKVERREGSGGFLGF